MKPEAVMRMSSPEFLLPGDLAFIPDVDSTMQEPGSLRYVIMANPRKIIASISTVLATRIAE